MDFAKAINVAEKNAKELIPGARNFALEEAIISGKTYEITLSYYLEGSDPFELSGDHERNSNLLRLAKIMGMKKEYKIFIVDKDNFTFKGFRVYKEK